MRHDTFNPLRILEAVKKFVVGLGERGEIGDGSDPAADAAAAATVAAAAATNWKTTLPDDIKADPIFEKYKEPADAFRALVSAQKFLGREKLPVPTDENDKEAYDLIFEKLGLPKSESDYQLPTDLQIPKELPLDEVMLADFKKMAHQHRLLPSQVSGLYKWYITSMIGAYNKFGEQKIEFTKEAETNLRKKWGAAYPQNIALAKKVFANFADEKAYAEFEKGAGNNPIYLEFFANIGKVLSEDQMIGKPHGLTMAPDEAQIEINKIKGDMKHPYWDAAHPLHKEAVANMERLMKLVTVE